MHLRGHILWGICILLSLLHCATVADAVEQTATIASGEMLVTPGRNVDREWVTEKKGEYVPLDTAFVDENGNVVTLGSIIDRPTLILPIYFFCPNACSKNLANLAVAINRLSFDAGKDYRVIALSFSDTENADNALRAKRNYLKLLYDGFPADAWKFLTGTKEAIKNVTDSFGYRFQRVDDETFIHPSALITVGADGKIIRYIYGSFVPGDIDMAISSAQEGVPALSVKRFLEFCLNYDPDKNKPVFQYVKIAVFLVFGVGLACIFYFGRKKKMPGDLDK